MTSLRALARGHRWGHPRAVPATAPRAEVPAVREVDTDWARAPLARTFRAAAQAGVLAPLVHAEVRLTVEGVERLTALGDEAAVLVMNHASHLDTAALLTALPAPVRARTVVAAAADYFFDRWWKGAGTALVFGTVPLARRGGSSATATPERLLRAGWHVVLFPEGTRSADGWTGRFRSGAAVLALACDAPVVPIAVRGSYAAMPRGRSWPAPGRPAVHVLVGDALRPRPGEDAAELTARVQAAVVRLLDEGETDWWSSLRRSAAGEQPALAGPPSGSWRRSWTASAPTRVPRDPGARVWR